MLIKPCSKILGVIKQAWRRRYSIVPFFKIIEKRRIEYQLCQKKKKTVGFFFFFLRFFRNQTYRFFFTILPTVKLACLYKMWIAQNSIFAAGFQVFWFIVVISIRLSSKTLPLWNRPLLILPLLFSWFRGIVMSCYLLF